MYPPIVLRRSSGGVSSRGEALLFARADALRAAPGVEMRGVASLRPSAVSGCHSSAMKAPRRHMAHETHAALRLLLYAEMKPPSAATPHRRHIH